MTNPARPLIALIAVGLVASASTTSRAGDFAFFHENVMGTSLELRVRAGTSAQAEAAEIRVLREIDRLSAILSNHDASSEFRRWQGGPRGPVKVSPELFALLEASDSWRTSSHGAFDPRVQSFSRLWASCAKLGRTPTDGEIEAAKRAIAEPAWRLDRSNLTAERLQDIPLTLDAIAKGLIVERACDAAMEGGAGLLGVLLNVGGDLRVRGDLERTIGISPPSRDSEAAEPIARIRVKDRAVATSGGYLRGVSIGGRWYSHIIDPRTGQACASFQSATVIARSSADADALATILNVVPPDEGLGLIRTVAGAECLIATADGKTFKSEGWGRFDVPLPLTHAQDPAKLEPEPEADSPSADAFELAVDFEIRAPEGNAKRRYRRPYVAIWLDNKDDKPVRNLILWVSLGGSGPDRWLPDLKRWYRGDKERRETDDLDLVFTAARATRAPGKYSVVWDGKDNHGKPLPPGEYTLNIETAREHGPYSIIRRPVTVADKPFAEELKGNAEIQSAAIAYRRKAEAPKAK